MRGIAWLVLLIACGSRDTAPTDDCEVFVAKAWRLLPEVAPTKLTKDEFLIGCRNQIQSGSANPGLRCVAEAKDEQGVKKCLVDAQEAATRAAVEQFTADVSSATGNLKIRYAAKTEPSANGVNNTYFSIVEDAALFVVADGADAGASKAVAELMGQEPPGGCPSDFGDEAQVRCAYARASEELLRRGVVTSVSAVIVRGRRALVATAGDVPVVWRHGAALDVVVAPGPSLGGTTKPVLRWLDVSAGHTIVILNRGLLETAGRERILRATPDRASETSQLERGLELLVGDMMRGRDYGALTAVFIHLVPAS